MLTAIERLKLFLRPAGRGIYTVSTGGGHAAPLLQAFYGSTDPQTVQDAWLENLQKIRRSDRIIVGIPSDTGAGIIRGANFGPIGVRLAYLAEYKNYPKGVLDLGDVLVVPQLLHDSMLNERQIKLTREDLYPGVNEELPVSPLSMLAGTIRAIHELNSNAKIFVVGGDHSVSWPIVETLQEKYGDDLGILHFDAHTDLLERRLGVEFCFGTWAYQAMKILKPDHLVQVGIRASGKPKEFWMQKYPIHQWWAKEVIGNEDRAMDEILSHFHKLELKRIYISNDIDGTDSKFAPATGVPEPEGLHPSFVNRLTQIVRAEFEMVGGDVVEVAPILSSVKNFEDEPTCQLAAHYLHTMLA